MSKYFKEKDGFIYLTCYRAEFIIPEYYFESKFGNDVGQTIEVLGLFDVKFYDKDDNELDSRVLNIPTWTTLEVYDYNKESIVLGGETEPTLCRIYNYYNDMKIMPSYCIADSANVESYLTFITSGKVPSMVPYSKTLKIWLKNQSMNKASLGVPSVILEMILAVAYREKGHPQNKFATIIGDPKSTVTEFDYQMSNIRQICQYTSSYTAAIFEDMDSMITSSLNRTLHNEKEQYSPTEMIMKL